MCETTLRDTKKSVKESICAQEGLQITLMVEVNAKQFVDWLLHLPTKKLMNPVRAADVTSVGRRLAELAYAKPELNFLSTLACDVWRLLINLPEGEVATNDDCIRFLEDFAPYLCSLDLRKAVAAIKSAPKVKAAKMSGNLKQLEYRMERPVLFAPAAFLGPRKRKPPADDISERLGGVTDAMTAAQCTRPVAYVTEALRNSGLLEDHYCTIRHVGSRIKKLGARIPLERQEVSPWLLAYWHSRHPEYVSKTSGDPEWPERFVFMKCDC
jgi:hypothetical protein